MQPRLYVWVDGRQSGARLHFIYHCCVAVNLHHCLSMTISLLVGLHLLSALFLCCCMCFRLMKYTDTLVSLYNAILWASCHPTVSSGICWTESVERVKSLLICVMAGVMLLSLWWCHGMRRRQTHNLFLYWLPGYATYIMDWSLLCHSFHNRSRHLKSGLRPEKLSENKVEMEVLYI